MAIPAFKKGDEVRLLTFEELKKKYPNQLQTNLYKDEFICFTGGGSIGKGARAGMNGTYKIHSLYDSGRRYVRVIFSGQLLALYPEELDMVNAGPEPDPNASVQLVGGQFSPGANDGIVLGEIDVTRYNLPKVKMKRYSPALYKIIDDRHKKGKVPLYNQDKLYYHKKQWEEHFEITSSGGMDKLIAYIKSDDGKRSLSMTTKQQEMWDKTIWQSITPLSCTLKDSVWYITYQREGLLGQRTTTKKMTQFLLDFGYDPKDLIGRYVSTIIDPIHVFWGNTDELKMDLDIIYKKFHSGSCQNGGSFGHAAGYGSLFKDGYLSIMLIYKDKEKKQYLGRCLTREMYTPDGEQIFYFENPYAVNSPFSNNPSFYMQRIVLAMREKGYRCCTYSNAHYNTGYDTDVTKVTTSIKGPMISGLHKGIYHHGCRLGFYHNTASTRTYNATRKDLKRGEYQVGITNGNIYEIVPK